MNDYVGSDKYHSFEYVDPRSSCSSDAAFISGASTIVIRAVAWWYYIV